MVEVTKPNNHIIIENRNNTEIAVDNINFAEKYATRNLLKYAKNATISAKYADRLFAEKCDVPTERARARSLRCI